MKPERLQIAFEVQHRGQVLECAYRGTNTCGATILVFDRLYSTRAGKWLGDWAYTRVVGPSAWASRGLMPLPRGLQHENPEVPHGREVAAGMTFGGAFRLELPLADRHPYADLLRRAPALPVWVEELTFTLAWTPMPASLPPAIEPVEREGERLWLLPYGMLSGLRQSAWAVRRLDPVPGLSVGR